MSMLFRCSRLFWVMVVLLVTAHGSVAGEEAAAVLEEIAQANRGSLDRIRHLQIEYETRSTYKEKEGSRVLRESWGNLYGTSKDGQQVRLRLNDTDGQGYVVDRYIAGGLERKQTYRTTFNPKADRLLPCEQHSFGATISPAVPRRYQELIPPALESIPFLAVSSPLTLTEIIRQWNCEITKDDGNTVLIRARLPEGTSEKHDGSYAVLKVRRDRGYRIEEARVVEVAAATYADTGEPASILSTFKVLEWEEPAPGVWFPRHLRFGNHGAVERSSDELGLFFEWEFKSVVVNSAEPERWLGFSFPENALVLEFLEGGTQGRTFLWGPDGEPAETFSDAAEFHRFHQDECVSLEERLTAVQSAASTLANPVRIAMFEVLGWLQPPTQPER